MCFNIDMTATDSSCFASFMAEKAAIERGIAGHRTI
jgi:hypothetical protein